MAADPGEAFDGEWERFYHAFEQRFRGSEESIAERLEQRYGERLRSFARQFDVGGAPVAVDLGCGRGEFLDLAKKAGFATQGVDSSEVAAEVCRKKEHKASATDMLSYLQTLPAASVHFASMLHVIEHCPQTYILKVFQQVQRVLSPQGAFLVETPSLFSLWAGTRQFYLDPTHLRPVHPEYIAFMGQYCGLTRVEVLLFDEVVHPQRASLSVLRQHLKREVCDELAKWDGWLHGPMDAALWMAK